MCQAPASDSSSSGNTSFCSSSSSQTSNFSVDNSHIDAIASLSPEIIATGKGIGIKPRYYPGECPCCLSIFPNKAILYDHIKIHHSQHPQQALNLVFHCQRQLSANPDFEFLHACTACSDFHIAGYQLHRHFKIKHPNQAEQLIAEHKSLIQNLQATLDSSAFNQHLMVQDDEYRRFYHYIHEHSTTSAHDCVFCRPAAPATLPEIQICPDDECGPDHYCTERSHWGRKKRVMLREWNEPYGTNRYMYSQPR